MKNKSSIFTQNSPAFRMASAVRAMLMRNFKPNGNYWLATRSLEPLSIKFGFDRGTPIDRYWMHLFLESNQKDIKGRVLEVTDNNYTVLYGKDKVTQSDVLDIDRKNKKATLYGDIQNLTNIQSDTYDCIVLTNVLGIIPDYEAAIRECHRILKKGGVLLLTVSSFSPTRDLDLNLWRFTVTSAKYVFGKYFNPKKLAVSSYGNVLTGQCYWVGMAQEELSKEALDYQDPRFSCLVAVRATK